MLEARHVQTTVNAGVVQVSVTWNDVRRIVGDVDDATLIETPSLNPSPTGLEEAAVWEREMATFSSGAPPLAAAASTVVDILTADEDEPPA